MRIAKSLVAIVGASALMAVFVGAAYAGRISTSSQTGRATFARVDFAGGFGTNECSLTIEGSFHSRTIVKSAGALIGYVTRAIIGACNRGSSTILAESLPWHVRYSSFAGTLPNITRLNLTATGMAFRIREPTFGVQCLASGGTATGIFNREAGGVLTSQEIGGESETDCGIPGTISGRSSSFTVLGAATRITVTLI